MKMTPSYLFHLAGSKHVLFDLERSMSKSDLRSGQVKVRLWLKWVNMHIIRNGLTNQVVWYQWRVFSSILSRVIGEKRIVASYDLRRPSRDPRYHQLHVEGGSADLVWWPDLFFRFLIQKKIWNVRNEYPLKFRKFQQAVPSRLKMAQEKPERAWSPPPR